MRRAPRTRCVVLGDGGWGTTLAIHLHRLGHAVAWWGAFPDYLGQLARRRRNPRYLPGVPIPRGIRIVPQLEQAVDGAELVILAIPSQYLRRIVRQLAPAAKALDRAIFVSVAKGIEHGTLLRMSEVVQEELGHVRLAVLSGPSISGEVARQQPASLVVASHRAAIAHTVQQMFTGRQLRLYTSRDVTGVELGGALKNPIAIAAGISDGLGFGANAKAALVTRGLVEIARLGVAMGARAGTFWGLSGLGDLITTCLSGRNRWLGEQLGHGRSMRRVLATTPMVLEGVETSRAACALGRRYRVELPIIEQVYAILFRYRSVRAAFEALMRRAVKPEAA